MPLVWFHIYMADGSVRSAELLSCALVATVIWGLLLYVLDNWGDGPPPPYGPRGGKDDDDDEPMNAF